LFGARGDVLLNAGPIEIASMQRRFFTLDVFTARRFSGNPLAVVLDTQGLDTAAMQVVAGEFNLSETVFVLPAANPSHRAAVRIFTPKRELPFAGHPTVGTAVLLALLDGGDEREIVLEEAVGPLPCRVRAAAQSGTASFALPKLPDETGPAPPAGVLAAALGLRAEEIGFGRFAPSCWSAGNPMIFVPLKTRDAVVRARPDPARLTEFGAAVFVFTSETLDGGHAFHARMFAPHLGIPEDPATGSAAAAFSGLLAQSGLADAKHSFVIEQGYEMGRPSLLTLGMTISGGKLIAASVGGGAVIVAEGRIEA
jgi:trans-2,3-dihydro-3-hydroxyanthranilate isomerase